MVGRGTGITVTEVETELVLLEASVTVADTTFVPGDVYTWAAGWLPVTEPSADCDPSPHSTTTLLTALPLTAGVITNVKVAGSPTLGAVGGKLMEMVGAVAMLTVTDADAWPLLPVPVPVPVPVEGAAAPTLAVTVAA